MKKINVAKKTAVALCGLLLAVSFASCGGGKTNIAQAKAKADAIKKMVLKKGPLPNMNVSGSVLNISLLNPIDNLDPQTSVYSSSFEILGCCMEGLMAMAADGSATNALAVSSETSPDGLVHTYKMRQDAYWANGDPVTAMDFVYAWQRAVDPATESEYSYMISDIAQIKNATAISLGLMNPEMLGVRALDPYTLQVELTTPVSYFDQLLYFCTFYPANRKFVESCGEGYGKSADKILSCGPFILTEFQAEKGDVVLVKNSAYHSAQKINLGGIHYYLMADGEAALKAYDSGKVDLVELDSDQVTSCENRPDFRSVATGFMFYLCPNVTKGDLQNVNLRRAINLALDRTKIAKILADGSLPVYSCVPGGYAFSSKGQDFTKEGVEFPEYCGYNPALARQYFGMAQRQLGKNRITVEFLTADTASDLPMVYEIKRQLESNLPGLTLNMRLVPRLDRRKIMARGEFELGLTNWGPDYPDPMTYLSMWMTGNEQNNGGYSNPKYDSIIANCTNGDLATKLDARWTAMKEATTMIMEDGVIMPVYVQCNGDLISRKISGIEFHAVAINRIYTNVKK